MVRLELKSMAFTCICSNTQLPVNIGQALSSHMVELTVSFLLIHYCQLIFKVYRRPPTTSLTGRLGYGNKVKMLTLTPQHCREHCYIRHYPRDRRSSGMINLFHNLRILRSIYQSFIKVAIA